MSFEMTQGLFKFDFTDQHAILGVPVDAEFNDIRKQYMKIVRRLHSDTCPFEEQADKDWANQFLSKVVNPAYNKFSKEGDRKEYNLLLTAIGKRAAKEPQKPQVESAIGKQLATAGNWEELYKTEVKKLSARQYESVEQALEVINQISELNMVYLLRKENVTIATGGGTPKPQTSAKPESKTVSPATSVAPPPPPKKDSEMDKYCRRAQGFMDSKNFAKAILELREAKKCEPKNSRCQAMLAMCYFQQGQATMAKIEMKNALASNPEEPMALEVKKKLEQPASGQGKKGDDKPAGLFASFTNLFGGKKK